jgi:hypothetical protein
VNAVPICSEHNASYSVGSTVAQHLLMCLCFLNYAERNESHRFHALTRQLTDALAASLEVATFICEPKLHCETGLMTCRDEAGDERNERS